MCWLDLAKDHREQPVLGALEFLVKEQELELIVPQMVVDDFQRNNARIIADAKRSLQSHFRSVRDAVKRYGNDASKASTPQTLSEVDHTIVTTDEAVSGSVDRIEKLLTNNLHWPQQMTSNSGPRTVRSMP